MKGIKCMAYCSNCGSEVKADYDFCPKCGNAIVKISESEECSNYYDTEKYKICGKCNEKMPEDAFYCLICGNTFDIQKTDYEDVSKERNKTEKVERPIEASEGVWKNKWISLVLCIFFGVFGLHRFYEEKRITGFIYLFTFGIFGMGCFFDIILILTKTNPYRVK